MNSCLGASCRRDSSLMVFRKSLADSMGRPVLVRRISWAVLSMASGKRMNLPSGFCVDPWRCFALCRSRTRLDLTDQFIDRRTSESIRPSPFILPMSSNKIETLNVLKIPFSIKYINAKICWKPSIIFLVDVLDCRWMKNPAHQGVIGRYEVRESPADEWICPPILFGDPERMQMKSVRLK